MALAKLGYGDEAVELFHMLNPINHTRDAAAVARYTAEPYVVAADVYAHPQHAGRGGWSWYTASAGLMYRAGIESIGPSAGGTVSMVDPASPEFGGVSLECGRHEPLSHPRGQTPHMQLRRIQDDSRWRPVDQTAILGVTGAKHDAESSGDPFGSSASDVADTSRRA